jgi:hypothetical protein
MPLMRSIHQEIETDDTNFLIILKLFLPLKFLFRVPLIKMTLTIWIKLIVQKKTLPLTFQ